VGEKKFVLRPTKYRCWEDNDNMAGRVTQKKKWYRYEGDIADIVPHNFCDYCCGEVEYHGFLVSDEAAGTREYFVTLRQRGEKYPTCVCVHEVDEIAPGKYKFRTECTGRLATMYELRWEYPHTFCSKLAAYTLQQLQALKTKYLETEEKTESGKERVFVELWLRGKKICTHMGRREPSGQILMVRHCCITYTSTFAVKAADPEGACVELVKSTVL
jgi:hypothetical protein